MVVAHEAFVAGVGDACEVGWQHFLAAVGPLVDSLKGVDERIPRNSFVTRDRSEDRVQSAEPEDAMSGDRNAMVSRFGSFQDDVASRLVNQLIAPTPAKRRGKVLS